LKFVDGVPRFRGRSARSVARIREAADRPRAIMEVCGGQTHAILKLGLDRLLEGSVGSSTAPAVRSA